jgi:hypothetical protein
MRDLIRKATIRQISSPIDAKRIPSTSRLISSPSDSADQSTTKPPLFPLSPKRMLSFSPDQDTEDVLESIDGTSLKRWKCPHLACKHHTLRGFLTQESLNNHLRRVHTDHLLNNEKAETRSNDAQAGEKRVEQKQQGDHGNRTETGCLQCRKQNKECDGIRPDCKHLPAYQMLLIFALHYYHTRYCNIDFEIGRNCIQGGFNCGYEYTLDIWAQIRKNIAELAARRQSEDQSKEGNNTQIIATDDGETSAEESRHIRAVISLHMLINMQLLRVARPESRLELPSSPAI